MKIIGLNLKFLMGGDLIKNDDLQKGKMVAVRRFLNTSSIFDGGDLMTNDDFQEGNIVNS